jgi:peptidoglycan/LPS O-acetylase OafA/YrhL
MQSSTHAPTRISALDGLRGLAVAGVLAYHCGFGWARGGFLGVSLFFTLSGFLITSLLLDERARNGRIALRAFWARRARRLLPAALIALGGIVAFGASVATGSQLRALRGDVLGALGYVANWRFIAAGTTYGSLWSSPSPVQHFWSLAIEEQLYVVLPLVITAALVLGRGRRRHVAVALGTLLAGSILATFLVHDQLRAYYGTDVRGAELLAGALLATVVVARPATRAPSWLGLAALGAVLLAWSTTSQPDARLYHGGLLLHAALVVVVIVAARGEGVLATVLSVRPLRWLGRISYAAYLYHWPLFLWLDEARTGLHGVPLAVVRVGVSLALASVSTRLLEEPIRSGIRLRGRVAPAAFAASVVTVAACLVAVTASPPQQQTIDLSVASPSLIAPPGGGTMVPPAEANTPTTSAKTITSIESRLAAAVSTPSTVPRAPGEKLRVYVAGDSHAFILGVNLLHWGETHGVEVWTSGWFACHIVPGGTYRWAGVPKHTEDKCNGWRTDRASEIAKIKPHIVLIIYGAFDMLDRKWDGSDTWTHIGNPDFDEKLDENISFMTDMSGYGGAHVVWAIYPRVRTGFKDGIPPSHDFPESSEARVDRLNTLIREEVARRSSFAEVLELRRHMMTWPGGELDRSRRPDGLHPSKDEAVRLASWIGDQLLEIAKRSGG